MSSNGMERDWRFKRRTRNHDRERFDGLARPSQLPPQRQMWTRTSEYLLCERHPQYYPSARHSRRLDPS